MMALPPSFTGAVHLTTADPLPGVAPTPVGAFGAVTDASAEGAKTSIPSAPAPAANMKERTPRLNPMIRTVPRFASPETEQSRGFNRTDLQALHTPWDPA